MNDEEALIDRIRQIIEQKRMNSSYFAEQIGSSRSVITHILNGRNKPSWDILKKILEKYDDINTEWLLFGKEPMFKSERSVIKPEKSPSLPSLFDKPESEDIQTEIKSAEDTFPTEYCKEIEVKPLVEVPKSPIIEEVITDKKESKKTSKIIIFYSDNTFESLSPDKIPFD